MSHCDLGASRTATGMFTANAIWETYLDDRRLRQFSIEDRRPEVRNRFPVTQEFMASALAAEQKGEAPPHPARQYFADALHDSIERMVGMLAAKYSITCIDEERDLAQECHHRIWLKLHTFDQNKAKFSTWAWRVCTNVLNREYQVSQKLRNQVCVPDEDLERNPAKCEHYETVLGMEYADAVRELSVKYPTWTNFIYALLGNPDTGTRPGEICVAHAAAKAKVGRGTAMNFYHGKIQPFLIKRFKQQEG